MALKDQDARLGATGLVLHAAVLYDVMAWLLTFGRERAFREKLLGLARLEPGESVLDVGCGTGTLAIAAKRQVGPTGAVSGIDASPEMLARAGKKATQAGVDVVFSNGAAQALPFADGQFDVVLNTLMLHHLPRGGRERCAGEMRRVLRRGGRLLAVDFGSSDHASGSLLAHFHRHGHVALHELTALFTDVGFKVVESGPLRFRELQFVLATAGTKS